jgi:hypothetical protein
MVPRHAINTFSDAMNSVEAPWIPELRRAGAARAAATLRRGGATDVIATPEPKSVVQRGGVR